jgi:2-polyprenyl-6-methoxyphenol hydroxylase-like FAD-dependent oxidoreductase
VVWSRTLELLHRDPGGATPFIDAGFKAHAVNFVAGSGELMGHVMMDSVKSPYPYGLMLPQSETERLLEERLASLGVSGERQTEVLSFTQTDSGIEARLDDGNGHAEMISTDWHLGCDSM